MDSRDAMAAVAFVLAKGAEMAKTDVPKIIEQCTLPDTAAVVTTSTHMIYALAIKAKYGIVAGSLAFAPWMKQDEFLPTMLPDNLYDEIPKEQYLGVWDDVYKQLDQMWGGMADAITTDFGFAATTDWWPE